MREEDQFGNSGPAKIYSQIRVREVMKLWIEMAPESYISKDAEIYCPPFWWVRNELLPEKTPCK